MPSQLRNVYKVQLFSPLFISSREYVKSNLITIFLCLGLSYVYKRDLWVYNSSNTENTRVQVLFLPVMFRMHTVSLWYLSYWKLKQEWSHIYLSPGSRPPVPTGSLSANLGADRSVHVSTQGWTSDVALSVFTSHKAVPPSLATCHRTLQSQRELFTHYLIQFRPIYSVVIINCINLRKYLILQLHHFVSNNENIKSFSLRTYVTISNSLQISEEVKQDFFIKIHKGCFLQFLRRYSLHLIWNLQNLLPFQSD